jgi:hypothetical protein
MNQDELDQKLSALQPGAAANTRQTGASVAGEAIRGLLSAVARIPAPAADIEAAREQARADALVAHRAKVLARRTELQWRIQGKLLAAIKAHPTPCALIIGPTGCGKTSAAQWLRAGLKGDWFHARELAACERRHSLGDGVPPMLERACSNRVVYIDDLGTEDARDVSVLQHVFERRYAGGLATVTTTGLTRAMLTERYGAASVRRMRDQHGAPATGGEWPVLVIDLHEGGAQ